MKDNIKFGGVISDCHEKCDNENNYKVYTNTGSFQNDTLFIGHHGDKIDIDGDDLVLFHLKKNTVYAFKYEGHVLVFYIVRLRTRILNGEFKRLGLMYDGMIYHRKKELYCLDKGKEWVLDCEYLDGVNDPEANMDAIKANVQGFIKFHLSI